MLAVAVLAAGKGTRMRSALPKVLQPLAGASLVERVFVIDDGQVVAEGSTRDIFSKPEELRRYGLGVPQVSALGYRLQEAGINLPQIPLTVAEAEADLWKILSS